MVNKTTTIAIAIAIIIYLHNNSNCSVLQDTLMHDNSIMEEAKIAVSGSSCNKF